MEASRCGLGPLGDRSERGDGWCRSAAGRRAEAGQCSARSDLRRRGRWTQVEEGGDDLEPPYCSAVEDLLFTQGGGGERRPCFLHPREGLGVQSLLGKLLEFSL